VRVGSSAWVIFTEELRGHLRSRWYMLFTALVVVLMLLAMVLVPSFTKGAGASSEGRSLQRIGFMDESGLFADLQADKGPMAYVSSDAGLQAVAQGKIDTFYVVPADYLKTGQVLQYADFPGRFPTNPKDEGAFRSLLAHGLVATLADSSVAERVLAPAAYENFRVDVRGVASGLDPMAEEIGGLLVPMLFAILLGVGLTVGFGYMLQSLAEEKESRLVEVVVTSASPLAIIGGKLVALSAAGLLQAGVWVLTAAFTLPVTLSAVQGASGFAISAGIWLTIVLCFIAGYLLTATLAIFVAAVAPSAREAGQMGGWIPVLSFAPFWVSAALMTQPDGLAGELVSYIPLVAPTGLLLRVAAGGHIAAWQVAASLGGVVLLSLVVMWAAARVFRAAILIRGQSFKLRNLWTALREAH
jgi:ABC-2 type transport system permease protein